MQSPIYLLFASKHQWRHSESANPGSNAITLGTNTCKLTRTLRNVTLHSLSVLLWTIKILTSSANNEVADVCNLWDQQITGGPERFLVLWWAGWQICPFLMDKYRTICTNRLQHISAKALMRSGRVLCAQAFAFHTGPHCSAWTELIKA